MAKKKEIPLYCKGSLSIAEAVIYTGINRYKLYEMTSREDCPFVLWVGHKRLIKRTVFDEYIRTLDISNELESGIPIDWNIERKPYINRETRMPIWRRISISVEEASAYSGIGKEKIYEITAKEHCPFVLWSGSRRLIKKEAFEDYLSKSFSI